MPRAVSFDFWDTLYDGAAVPERRELRLAAFRRLFETLGRAVSDEELRALHASSHAEAERWWREEHRGYTAADRIRWMLEQVGIRRPADCEHVARACEVVDEALLRYPPSLLPGAGETVRALAERYALAIISDTGFPSGRAQDRLLERDGLLAVFPVRIYSMDVGHAKPRREPFAAAARALDLPGAAVLHVGNNERTDIEGAIAAGLRAVRLDVVGHQGPSAAEFVARSFEELIEYLSGET
jgi:putative hydrolase of the HAD superfamily